MDAAKSQLLELFALGPDPVVKLRALWSLYVIGAADGDFLRAQLRHSDEHVRVWAIRLLSDAWPLDTITSGRPANIAGNNQTIVALATTLNEFVRLAKADDSALVCLALATVLQRLPVSQRADLAAPLLAHAEDAADHNLPLKLWYGLIPLGDAAPATLAKLAGGCQLPLTRRLMARRLGEYPEKNPAPLNDLLKLSANKSESFQADMEAGLTEALRGWRKAQKPAAWNALQAKLSGSENVALRDHVRDLGVLFGDGRALDEVKRVALDGNAGLQFRRAALLTLIENRPPELREICDRLLSVRFLNSTAVRGLAPFDDPEIGETLARSYRLFHPSERGAVMDTLASRPSFARPLLDEVAVGLIPRADVTPFHAR